MKNSWWSDVVDMSGACWGEEATFLEK
jgi:hypothetical protein